MEFVHGETLEDGLRARPDERARGHAGCQDVCRALAAVHLAGFVHQDVKARNVMREQAGRIVLMDFGAGQDVSQLAVFGKAGVAGTPLYMAPEVLAGQAASPTSDVYSVGVLLYHLVTAAYPVEGHTLDEIRAAHMQGRRRLLGERRPELPVPFLQVVDRALAADPARRYAAAAQFLEALVGITDDVKAPVPQMSLLLRALWGSAAVLLAAVGLGFIASMEFNQALGRSDFVRETPVTWLIWGFRSWLGTIVTLLMIGLMTSALLVVRQLILTMPRARDIEGRMVDGTKRRLRRFGLHDPVSGIVSGAVLAAAGALVSGFWYFGPFLGALFGDLSRAPADIVEMLSPANRPLHELYRKAFTGIMIFSGFVWYATWRLARSRRDIVHIAIFASAGAVFLFSAIWLNLPYRVIYQNRFEVVRWQGQDCYATGERQDDVLLFCPGSSRAIASSKRGAEDSTTSGGSRTSLRSFSQRCQARAGSKPELVEARSTAKESAMRRVSLTLVSGVLFGLVFPSSAHAWWGWIDELSGAGRFRGWEVEARLYLLRYDRGRSRCPPSALGGGTRDVCVRDVEVGDGVPQAEKSDDGPDGS